MKYRPILVPLIALLFVPLLSAQNFSGSDDFSSPSGNWMAGPSAATGQMSVNFDALNFTDLGLATGVTSNAIYSWTANAGSYIADWQVQVDFTANAALLPGEIFLWELVITNGTDATDFFTAALQRTYMQQLSASPPDVQSYTHTDSAMIAPGYVSQASSDLTTAALRISFNAASTTLTASFDGDGLTGGYVFTDFNSVDISTGAADWNMVTGDFFTLRLQAWHSANASATFALVEGAYTADNFLATGTPVPEPATVALFAGLGVLGFVLWRRRA